MPKPAIFRRTAAALGLKPADLVTDQLFAIRADTNPAMLTTTEGPRKASGKPFALTTDGVAIVPILGPLSKRPSIWRLFGLTDGPTMPEIRSALLAAAADPDVHAIALYVDSPGGTAEGTHELAEAVRVAGEAKPVEAYVSDLAASGAYWVGCQAQRVTVNAPGRVGSIGVFSILVDFSKAADRAGLKFHRITTGPFKGAGAPGIEITPEQLAAWQVEVEAVFGLFVDAVAKGRGLPPARVRKLADGRLYVGQRAVDVGLADAVGTFADVVESLLQVRRRRPAGRVPIAALSERQQVAVLANRLGLQPQELRQVLAAAERSPRPKARPKPVAAGPFTAEDLRWLEEKGISPADAERIHRKYSRSSN